MFSWYCRLLITSKCQDELQKLETPWVTILLTYWMISLHHSSKLDFLSPFTKEFIVVRRFFLSLFTSVSSNKKPFIHHGVFRLCSAQRTLTKFTRVLYVLFTVVLSSISTSRNHSFSVVNGCTAYTSISAQTGIPNISEDHPLTPCWLLITSKYQDEIKRLETSWVTRLLTYCISGESKTKQNKTKQNKTKQNKTKQTNKQTNKKTQSLDGGYILRTKEILKK